MERKPFLLRLDPVTMAAMRAWASDDLRSLNGQIEFLLRRTLREAGRLPAHRDRSDATAPAIDDDHATTREAPNGSDAAVPALQGRSDPR